MNMKKFLILIMSAVIMISLAACGNSEDDNEAVKPNNDGGEHAAVSKTIEGYVGEGTSMSVLQLDTEAGTYMFSTDGADIKTEDSGLFEGDKVKVTYEGELGKDGETVKAVAVELLEVANADVETPDASSDTAIQGVVVDASTNSITIQKEDGSTQMFGTEGASMPSDGVLIDDIVVVTYDSHSEKNDAIKVEKVN